MDADRFDTLARSLTDARSRRAALTALLGSTLSLVGLAETEAKKKCPPCKKRKNGNCKKNKPDGTACPGGTCRGGRCIPANGCPPDRVCGNGCCPDGQTCQQGQCAAGGNGCPDGQKPCGTACILAGQCCTDTDCPTGTTCCDRLCTDTTADPRHCGGCATACPAVKTCAASHCCTARQGAECTATSECCGTDVCDRGPTDDPKCVACVPEGGDSSYNTCCPGLFRVFRNGETTCVACKLTDEPCQNSNECCANLICSSAGKCAELVVG
jgi:hypothetical protein